MSVVVYESVVRRFFHEEAGPVGRLINRKASEVFANTANNMIQHVRSGQMLEELTVRGPYHDADSLYMLVGSSATAPWRGHPDFNYPIAQELGGVTPDGIGYGPFRMFENALLSSGFRKI